MNKHLFSQSEQTDETPVECLGESFPNDKARHAYFTEQLRNWLKEQNQRTIDGFPVADDDAILSLSDPPYYTACPNPFLDSVATSDPDAADVKYDCEPFASDVSEGKGSTVYNAHSYHTKVPHQAIMRYILHYTQPGDVVLDSFCGTGMTGVAARLCGDKQVVESLGYSVKSSGEVYDSEGRKITKLGARTAILCDLSPVATFIASGYNTPENPDLFEDAVSSVMKEAEDTFGWLYATLHNPKPKQIQDATARLSLRDVEEVKNGIEELVTGRLHYAVWSDVFVCAECGEELVFWKEAVIKEEGKVRDSFPCPHCNASMTKRRMDYAWATRFDSRTGDTVREVKRVPVLLNYTYGGKTYEKEPDEFDLRLAQYASDFNSDDWFPTDKIPAGDKTRDPFSVGIERVHQYFTQRNLTILSYLWNHSETRHLRWCVTGIMQRASRQHQIAITRIGGPKAGEGGATAGHRRGTLYIPSNQVEFHPLDLFSERAKTVSKTLPTTQEGPRSVYISTGSATSIRAPDSSVDYIFVDPPFGGNIMYSELNFAWEALLKVFTNTDGEAIQNKSQSKTLLEYQELMTQCFAECQRVLKPGRWMTVEFHNSKNSVWNAIQEALQRAGFVVADVRTLDKKLKTHTQRTAAGSVNQDLVITAYKTNPELERVFGLHAGTAEGAWDFVHSHLEMLPVVVEVNGAIEPVVERQKFLLFDRMVAFHVERGVAVPLSAAEFYEGLAQRFAERDEMYFLSDQVPAYEKKRMSASEVRQLQLFVSDESSAIQWLRQQLTKKPQTFQEIQPQFIREIGGWEKYEKPLELSEMLDQNFLCYDGKGEVPGSIHSYLSSNFHDLRNLSKADSKLIEKAKSRWYVPDARNEADLEKKRQQWLLREFNDYLQGSGKLKIVRTEALRAGFKECWQKQDFQTIVNLAKRVKDDIIQEDPALLMYYDNALMRTGD